MSRTAHGEQKGYLELYKQEKVRRIEQHIKK
jgi:hypothetical protein